MRKENLEQHDGASKSAAEIASTKMWEEAAKAGPHKTYTNTFDNINQLGEFGKGVVIGAVDGGTQFLEFAAAPQKHIPKLAQAAQEALGTAANYYADKLFNNKALDITKDAGDGLNATGNWLIEYGKKPPYERGKLCGNIATDVLIAETGAQIAKAACNGVRAAKRSDSGTELYARGAEEEFWKFYDELDDIGKSNFGDIRAAAPAADFIKELDWLKQELPESLKNFVKEKNVRIVPLLSIGQLEPEFSRFIGLFINSQDSPIVMLSEYLHRMPNGMLDVRRMEQTLRHELTHAIDRLTVPGKWLSDGAEIREAFHADLLSLSPVTQDYLTTAFGMGSRQRLRKEMVAELVSRKAVPGADECDYQFVQWFKNLDRILKDSPYFTHK